LGVHRFLRVTRDFPIMGDCGAFDYIMREKPPYSTEDVLDYYTRLGFDFGVSVDHLIVTATEHQKKFRYELTIHNAQDFLKHHRKAGLKWEPIGAVQGWDPESYATAAAAYVKMGYRYLGLGGLVRTNSREILRTIHAVRQVVPGHTSVHLFGVARLDALPMFQQVGINSVDSASYLRQAWMRLQQSYASFNGPYAALRIPEAEKSFRAKHMKNHAGLTEEKIIKLEQDALKKVRALAENKCSVERCLEALLAYDQYVTTDRAEMAEPYRRTLNDRPWESCECEICKRWGIEIAIFRGNNRNRRRGFHNTYVFYRLMQRVLYGESMPFLVGKRETALNQFELPNLNAL
jgi:queuine/archaeosine tRNA-ribosyltransferase